MNADEIIKVLNDLCDKFGIAIDWSNNNVLPYIQKLGERIVAYEFWTSIVWIIICLLLLVVSIVVLKKIIKWINQDDFDKDKYEDRIPYCIVACIVIAIVCCSFIIVQIFDIITCFTFPEKIIITRCMDIYNTYSQQ